jgi:hypothetical protein
VTVAAIDLQFTNMMPVAERDGLIDWHADFSNHGRAINPVPDAASRQREHRQGHEKRAVEQIRAGLKDLG